MRQLGDDGTPDEALDGLLVCSVHVKVPKANCHNRWTVGEHRPHSKFLQCAVGRSDVVVAKVAAPASDPSLRRLPRSIQFQGLRISISVSRSLQKSTSSARPEKLTPQASRHADLPRG
ncbi:hypothetical protein ABBQ38_001299 [Trebouxia sp. C0009 RCD-2024]